MASRGELAARSRLSREDRRSLALHAAIAEHVRRTPDAVLLRARATLARMRAMHPGARGLCDDWKTLLDGPLTKLLAALRDPGEHARDLRQVTPFAGILSPRERANVYRNFRADEAKTANALTERRSVQNSSTLSALQGLFWA